MVRKACMIARNTACRDSLTRSMLYTRNYTTQEQPWHGMKCLHAGRLNLSAIVQPSPRRALRWSSQRRYIIPTIPGRIQVREEEVQRGYLVVRGGDELDAERQRLRGHERGEHTVNVCTYGMSTAYVRAHMGHTHGRGILDDTHRDAAHALHCLLCVLEVLNILAVRVQSRGQAADSASCGSGKNSNSFRLSGNSSRERVADAPESWRMKRGSWTSPERAERARRQS
jgi:hypothetical protein